MKPYDKDPVLVEMARVLREGRARMPSQTFEESYVQIRRALAGHTVQPKHGGNFGPEGKR